MKKKHRHKWTEHECDCDKCYDYGLMTCECGAEKWEGEKYNPKENNYAE